MSRRALGFGIGLALVLQVVLGWIDVRPEPRRLWGDEPTYWEASRALERGEEADLLGLWPPLYPRLVAWLSPASTASVPPPGLVLAQIALLGLAALALARFGEVALGEARAAHLAALAMILSPSTAAFAHYLWPEIVHLALFLGALACLARFRAGWAACFGAGLLLGLAVLSKSLLVGFLPLLGAILMVAESGEWRRQGLRRALGATLGLITVLALAAAAGTRPRDLLGSSGWFNAWVGLNDSSTRNLTGEIVGTELEVYRRSAETVPERTSIARRKVFAKIEADGLGKVLTHQVSTQYFRLLGYDSFFTDMLPGGAIAEQGAGYRLASGWLSRSLAAIQLASYAALLLGAVWGALVLPWRDRRWSWVIGAFVLYNLALFLVLHVKTRYRLQFEPFLWLLAASAWTRRAEIVLWARRSWTFVLLGTCGSLTLLFLAFGRSLVSG